MADGQKVPATLAPFGGAMVVKCPKPQAGATVGETGNISFVIEFPDPESATNWYNSADYQELAKSRDELATFNMVVCGGM